MKLQLEPCIPPRWAKGGHTQTLWGHLLPSARLSEPGEGVEIPLPDGDRLTARFHEGRTNHVIYFFHGLGGDANADYMQRSARIALNQGHSVFRVNHRGCGEGKGLAQLPYHSGRAEDLSEAIRLGRKRFPDRHHVAVGFSLSGNALLLLLSGERGEVKPDAALAVNAPIALEKTALSMKQGFNRLYDQRFVIRCKLQAGEPASRVPWRCTLYDFDEAYTAPRSGFLNRNDYYTRCSTAGRLHAIGTKTVLLMTEDDPIVPVEDYLSAKLGPGCTLLLEKVGGHMGYLSAEATPLGSIRWLDYAVDGILRELTR